MLPEMPTRSRRRRRTLGISLFAGEAEGRFDEVLRDACAGTLKPLYNFMNDLPGLEARRCRSCRRRGSSAPAAG